MHIVLISRHYAAGGSGGARRPFHWVKGLREAGHRVTLVTPEAAPGEIDVITIPHPHPAVGQTSSLANQDKMASQKDPMWRRFARNWRYWPDPDVVWYKAVQAALPDQIKAADWVITTSPPESAHRFGGSIAQMLGAKWCAEFRDPWLQYSLRPYLKGLRRTIEAQLAKRWMRRVDAAILVHDFMRETSQEYLPPGTPMAVIEHFCDPFDDVASDGLYGASPSPLKSDHFNLIYAGGISLSDYRRDIADLLAPLHAPAEARAAAGLDPLNLVVCGRLSPNEVSTLDAMPLSTSYVGALPFHEAVALQAQADALLVFAPDGVPTLPGKYVDGLALGKPIIWVGDRSVIDRAALPNRALDPARLSQLPRGMRDPYPAQASSAAAVAALIDLLERADDR